jgi:hypothetical protein
VHTPRAGGATRGSPVIGTGGPSLIDDLHQAELIIQHVSGSGDCELVPEDQLRARVGAGLDRVNGQVAVPGGEPLWPDPGADDRRPGTGGCTRDDSTFPAADHGSNAALV